MLLCRWRQLLTACLAGSCGFLTVVWADWPQWRGPNRDGISEDFRLPSQWPASLKEAWKVTVGEGHSSPVSAEGRVYVLSRQGEEEAVSCLDGASGKTIWKSTYPAAYTMNPAATGHGKGPKSTPAVGGGRVFALGINGVLSCFDARTGKLEWRHEFSKQYPSTSPLYGTAMSPLVLNELCIAHVGGHDKGALSAFDVQTGLLKWAWHADGPAYSSPVVATLAGEAQLITYTQNYVVGISPVSGKLLWKIEARRAYDTNSVTPVVYKDLIVFSLDERGIGAVRVVKQGTTFATHEVWRNPAMESYMNTPVLHGSRLIGFSYRKRGQFFCIDAETGKTLWEGPGRAGENAAILRAGGVLFLLTNEARLIVLKADSAGYEPLREYSVATSPTWAHPALLGNRILIKDQTSLTSLSF